MGSIEEGGGGGGGGGGGAAAGDRSFRGIEWATVTELVDRATSEMRVRVRRIVMVGVVSEGDVDAQVVDLNCRVSSLECSEISGWSCTCS